MRVQFSHFSVKIWKYELQKKSKLSQKSDISLDNSINNNWAKFQSIWIKFCGSSSVHRFQNTIPRKIVSSKVFFFL